MRTSRTAITTDRLIVLIDESGLSAEDRKVRRFATQPSDVHLIGCARRYPHIASGRLQQVVCLTQRCGASAPSPVGALVVGGGTAQPETARRRVPSGACTRGRSEHVASVPSSWRPK